MTDSKRKKFPDETETSSSETIPSYEDETAATLAAHPEVGEILEKLEPEEKEIITTMISYSGPLPPPEYLQGYMEVYPEAGDKIFGWAEEQQIHRRKLESNHLKNAYRYNTTGLILGFIVVVGLITGAFTLIYWDKDIMGISLLAPLLIGLGSLFVGKNRKLNKNNKTDDDNDDE